ncbi:hypothetical protein BCR33DRAFT_721852 [Rhizoclosmatium globosum]|uniref:Uncharacterized protein n=1 Tax=Rhizoclosmatium globosum TaxID=329046 RepID=A0A1Y2BPE8_9FUNG|nr:hypothetical protein BCR33DRAFT_721852 [Rhizoclosmatium globosum]|eukprot:ORY36623.1 hypothetical protein BCR33DRAFT_721852 [Rhizoclosmatium globosum]
MIGYMNLSNTNLTSITIPFSVAIGTILIHALLLLAISLRLGAYRAANYHHTHATRCYSNPVSKIRIHSPAVFVVVGTVGFSGGLLVGLFMDDYSLGGFWPFIPAGAVSLSMGWLSLMWI